MKLIDFQEKIAGVDGSLPVLVRDNLHSPSFAFEVAKSFAMTRSSFLVYAPFVHGRSNAKRYTLIESNVAFYPSIAQSRKDALTVRQLRELLAGPQDVLQQEILVRSGGIPEQGGSTKPTYRPMSGFFIASISASGRPEIQSRGGVPALVLFVN